MNAAPSDPSSHHKHGLLHRLRNYLFTGILVSAPITLTIYLTLVFLNFVDSRVARILPPGFYPEEGIPGFGLVMTLTFFVVVGWLATNFLGRFIINLSEKIVERMPVIRTVYSAFKQVFEMLMGQQAQAFREVVLVTFPYPGHYSLAFVTGGPQPEIQKHVGEDMLHVLLPTAPNPMTGFLVFVRAKDAIRLNMSVEDGMKMVVSGGIISPPERFPVPVDTSKLPHAFSQRV